MAAAVTFALISADHHRVKYLVTSDGAAAGNLDAAGAATPDLLTDTNPTAAGINREPLHTLLGTVVADQAAARALMRGNLFDVKFGPGGTATADWIIDFNSVGATDIRITCTCAAADAVGTVLEIEAVHSQVR